jgi:hypothetical protein
MGVMLTQNVSHSHKARSQTKGWPEPYIYTIYDRIFGFPAKITVYTPYIYGFGQPCSNGSCAVECDAVCGKMRARNHLYPVVCLSDLCKVLNVWC